MSARVIDIREGMRFGIGVDSILEAARGEALVFDGEQGRGGGQVVRASVRMIESQTSLMESMNISVGVSARYGLASADAKVNFAEQHAVNEYSLTMLFTADVRNPARSMVRPRLNPSAEALYKRDPNAFLALYGDTYIDEIYGGGEFFGLFIFNTRDESSRSELKIDLEVSIGSFMAGGDLSASFSNTIQRHSRSASMQIRALMSGGSGLKNPRDLSELGALYSNFNASVAAAPIDYKVGLKEFKYLPLPQTDSWVGQAARKDTIDTCGRMVVEGISMRSRIDYILSHPEQFEPFDEPTLETARSRVVSLVKQCVARVEECSRDLGRCHLEELQPVDVDLPRRLASTNPLAAKWEKMLRDDRAKGWFSESLLSGTSIDEVQEHEGGTYKLFVLNGLPISGIFWNPRVGAEAFAVYGGIFSAYLARGHCQGPLGFPTSDEQTLKYGSGAYGTEYDGLDRISNFERGVLWWDAQTHLVSDRRPRSIHDVVANPQDGPFINRIINR